MGGETVLEMGSPWLELKINWVSAQWAPELRATARRSGKVQNAVTYYVTGGELKCARDMCGAICCIQIGWNSAAGAVMKAWKRKIWCQERRWLWCCIPDITVDTLHPIIILCVAIPSALGGGSHVRVTTLYSTLFFSCPSYNTVLHVILQSSPMRSE